MIWANPIGSVIVGGAVYLVPDFFLEGLGWLGPSVAVCSTRCHGDCEGCSEGEVVGRFVALGKEMERSHSIAAVVSRNGRRAYAFWF
jgi:hypothetical protein